MIHPEMIKMGMKGQPHYQGQDITTEVILKALDQREKRAPFRRAREIQTGDRE